MDIYNDILKGLKEKGAKGTITKESNFKDLGIDSLDLMDMIILLEDKLSIRIPDEELGKLNTINDLIELIKGLK